MKKGFFVLMFVLSCVSIVTAEDVVWGSMYGAGNLNLGADAAYEWTGASSQLGLYPEAEIILWKPEFGGLAFLDVGAALDGRVGLPVTASSFSAGAGLFGTLHVGFRGFDFPGSGYLGNVDYFVKAGVKFDFIAADPALGAAFQSGVNYYISDGFSVGVFYSSWGTFSGGGISASLKLGDTPAVKGMTAAVTETSGGLGFNPFLMQFYTFYYSSHFAGGFYPETYSPGDETVYEISSIDSTGKNMYTLSKSLLRRSAGEAELWSLEYRDDSESFYYEYTVDSDGLIDKVYYSNDAGKLVVMNADADYVPEAEYLSWEDYNADKKSGVKVSIKAGRFDADEYSYTDESGVKINWWTSDKVPGRLLSYKMEDDSDIVTSELIEINKGKKPRLNK